jgi:hypothetical protein
MMYKRTYGGKNARIETSKQYPNSSTSPLVPPGGPNRPCCLLLPGSPAIPGPRKRPTRKYAIVERATDPARKCTKTNISANFTTFEKAGVYASDHAKEVRIRKKQVRYVKEGSGRCHVFFVSAEIC